MSETEIDGHGTDEMIHGYPASEIEEGEKIMESPISDNVYRVTKWVTKGEDRFIALEKELIDDD